MMKLRSYSLLATLFVVAACGRGGGGEPAVVRTSSQLVLSAPPYLYLVGDLSEDWRWRAESPEPTVEFQEKESTNEETLVVPGSQLLFAARRELGGVEYFLAGTIDANEVFALYRYHDVTADGAPDASTSTLLFTTGTRPAYVTDVQWANDGTAFMLDRRCQDILVATDTNANGWADSYQVTPFAMSDNFSELLEVVDLEVVAVGPVNGWTMSRDSIDRARITSHLMFPDDNGDRIADGIVEVPRQKRPIEMYGTPYDGQTELRVRGEPDAEVQVWDVNDDLNPVTLLATVTLGSRWEDWTSISLGSGFTLGDTIGVRYTGDSGSQVAQTVWQSWPQIVEFDRMIATYSEEPGQLGLIGYNFTNDMVVTMTTPTGTTHTLTYTYTDANNVTVDIPVLSETDMGYCSFEVRDPAQPDGDGTSIEGLQVCPEDELVSHG